MPISGASGSGELVKTLNSATALHNTSTDSIENETITWNWNPQASSKLSIENNCFGQKRNRNSNSTDEASHLASALTANGRNLSVWSEHDDTNTGTDVKNSHFWSKVLFNSNGNGNCSSSSSSSGSKDQRRTNLFPSASNTAVIFNNIISNLKDHHPKSIDLSDMDAIDRNFNMSNAIVQNSGDGNATSIGGTGQLPSGSDSKSKNLSQKHKTVKNRLDRRTDANHYEQSNADANDGVFRLPLDNDLNAANSTFLRALNDLHLDYNDLTGTTNAVANRQEHNESTAQSKERFV